MKNFKLGLLVIALLTMTGVANASGVGYIDYVKVIDNYEFAKKATKEVDAKGLEMQQYLVDKEKEYKSLDTPLKKQSFAGSFEGFLFRSAATSLSSESSMGLL